MAISAKAYPIKDLTVNDGSSPIQIDTGSFTFPAAPNDTYAYYRLTGTSTLVANMTVVPSGTLHDKIRIQVLFDASVTLGVYDIVMFGQTIPADIVSNQFLVEAVYDATATRWTVIVYPDFAGTGFITNGLMANDSVDTNEIVDDAVTNAKLANITRGSVKVGGASNAPTDLDAKTSGNILVGDGTDVNSVAVSGDATLSSTGALTIGSNAITTGKITDANVTLAKLEQKLLYDMFTIRLDTKSAAATGNVNFTMPYDCDITHIVITALEAPTDDDTSFVFKDNGSASMGSIDVPITASIGNKFTLGSSGSPLSSNNSFSRDHNLLIEVSKSTTTSGVYHIGIYTERT